MEVLELGELKVDAVKIGDYRKQPGSGNRT